MLQRYIIYQGPKIRYTRYRRISKIILDGKLDMCMKRIAYSSVCNKKEEVTSVIKKVELITVLLRQ
jgi:hypothetical protein